MVKQWLNRYLPSTPISVKGCHVSACLVILETRTGIRWSGRRLGFHPPSGVYVCSLSSEKWMKLRMLSYRCENLWRMGMDETVKLRRNFWGLQAWCVWQQLLLLILKHTYMIPHGFVWKFKVPPSPSMFPIEIPFSGIFHFQTHRTCFPIPAHEVELVQTCQQSGLPQPG